MIISIHTPYPYLLYVPTALTISYILPYPSLVLRMVPVAVGEDKLSGNVVSVPEPDPEAAAEPAVPIPAGGAFPEEMVAPERLTAQKVKGGTLHTI